MLMHYGIGQLGVRLTRREARSALPDAPVVRGRPTRPSAVRIRTAAVLYRLGDLVGPAGTRLEARSGNGRLRQA